MASNVLLGKSATAGSCVMPYEAARAIDGRTREAVQRWLGRGLPGWLQVDLGQVHGIDRWVVWHLPGAGWACADYTVRSYGLAVSLDGENWSTVDTVVDNRQACTDRHFNACFARYVRLEIHAGLWVNPDLASILEWEVFDANTVTSARLVSLGLSAGALTPPFDGTAWNFSAAVEHAVESVTLTPVAEDPRATVRVQGEVVAPGTASLPIALAPRRDTCIDVVVHPLCGPWQLYRIMVARAAGAGGIAYYLGQIALFAPHAAPPGWVECAGQTIEIDNRNQNTFCLLGDRFGGDGFRTFGLPDLRGKSPLAACRYFIALTPDSDTPQIRYPLRSD